MSLDLDTLGLSATVTAEGISAPDYQTVLDTTEGTPWIQSVLGKQKPDTYNLAIRRRILETQGVSSITELNTEVDGRTRRVTFTATVETIYGTTTVTSEA